MNNVNQLKNKMEKFQEKQKLNERRKKKQPVERSPRDSQEVEMEDGQTGTPAFYIYRQYNPLMTRLHLDTNPNLKLPKT